MAAEPSAEPNSQRIAQLTPAKEILDDREDFAAAIRERALIPSASLGDFVDPKVGVFVTHNIDGCCPPIDHVDQWPNGRFNYLDYVPEATVLAVLATLSDLPRARKVLIPDNGLVCEELVGSYGGASRRCSDDDGCEPRVRYLDSPGFTPLDHWAGVLAGTDPATLESVVASELIDFPPEELASLWPAPTSTHGAFRRATEAILFEVAVDGVEYYFGRTDAGWSMVAIDLYDPPC